MSLELPTIKSNPDGWGPIGTLAQFNDIPYAPFSKGDKIGKCSDWNASTKNYQRQNYYGANAFNPFTFKLEDDEDSFQLVDYTRGRVILNRGGNRKTTKFGNKWNDRRQKNRESSIEIGSNWELKEEIDLSTFKTLAVETVPETETIGSYGTVKYYNKSYDKLNARDEKKLQKSDKVFPSVPTSDDKVIRKEYAQGTVYATDTILATLMTAHRSVYSWDIVVIRVGRKLFFEMRPGTTEYVTVNENATQLPDDKDPINNPTSLSAEATTINQNYWQQVLSHDVEPFKFENPIPDSDEFENNAEAGYRYNKWNLGDDIVILARTQVDGVLDDKGQQKFFSIKAINEFDPSRGIEFRKKIDSQRAAILATEMKNNSTKFAKWSIQATLAGCDSINLGFVSRSSARDNNAHVILSTQFYPVSDLNRQNSVDMRNSWGVLKRIIQSCMSLENGKYLLHRDPNRNVINLFSVPENAFDPEEEEVQEEEEESLNKGWVDESRE
eukprot:gene6782-8414_t